MINICCFIFYFLCCFLLPPFRIKVHFHYQMNFWYLILSSTHWIPPYMPYCIICSELLFNFNWSILFQQPLGCVMWLFIYVLIHEIGHIIILLYHGYPFEIKLSCYSVSIHHNCKDRVIYSSGIMFLYLFLNITSIISSNDYIIIGLLLCLVDSLPLKWMDGFYCY
ncbi:hypothetical protein ENU1_177060 [Entamoeba nuttalli P19]|uniref:Uncharacterized protein n=2 Tax=Entamoeba nuttalli TaxID=412467 RepID=K2HQA5_ENTNP|nr:hypothetical protein ENU1_177060 [Entamoeba nuttalli P19]EKE38085.1 hypothetical protein ENU1_177060 [Entamoeba nuttalli P19]|eukprot:XP_008859578.1 hypothetical protein ENU1_177060 [Entamoeba nuttalli P19]